MKNHHLQCLLHSGLPPSHPLPELAICHCQNLQLIAAFSPATSTFFSSEKKSERTTSSLTIMIFFLLHLPSNNLVLHTPLCHHPPQPQLSLSHTNPPLRSPLLPQISIMRIKKSTSKKYKTLHYIDSFNSLSSSSFQNQN